MPHDSCGLTVAERELMETVRDSGRHGSRVNWILKHAPQRAPIIRRLVDEGLLHQQGAPENPRLYLTKDGAAALPIPGNRRPSHNAVTRVR